MSPWDRFSWREYGTKKPPPEHGIKIKKAGVSWWGKHWLEALEHVLGADSGRLSRGRSYARAGRTHDLVVKRGKVHAKVTGSRDTPYEITIALSQLTDQIWQRVIAAMAEKAQFSAELLANRMPEQLDEVFRDASTSLFPRDRADLVTTCSCPDWGDPCKHVAATHYVLGDALDRDPFLLFELRGRTKDQVLSALRSARGAEPVTTGKRRSRAPKATAAPEVPRVTATATDAKDYDRPRSLPALSFAFDAPVTHGAVLRQLGVPAAWRAEGSPADTLAPLVRRAAEHARRIALAETGAVAEPEPEFDAEPSPANTPTRTPRAPGARKNVAKKPRPRTKVRARQR